VQTSDIYVSPELLEEYRAVPEELLVEEKISSLQWQTLVAGIASVVATARVVYPQRQIAICRDPEDDMVLTCCLSARANILITGDKDLLDITRTSLRQSGLGRLQIMTPRIYVSSYS
jgi:putative PIN family toxin of toxin-antitoxin system